MRGMTSINRTIVKWVQAGSGGEYFHSLFKKWHKQRHIGHEVTNENSFESEGGAERLNRSLLSMAWIMLLNIEHKARPFG